jgi:hypothetical protein
MKKDEALDISNPRLLSATYFSLLAIIITITIDTILYGIGITQLLPTFEAVILATFLAACFGAIFGKKIIYSPIPYGRKAFIWGFLMVLAALPFYDLIFLYLINLYNPRILEGLTFTHILLAYLFIIFYSFLLAGLWLAIAAGLAAVYLRGHIVYDILHSKNDKLKEPHQTPPIKTKSERTRASKPK